jgi:hypothetical protein
MDENIQTPDIIKPTGVQGLFPKPVKIVELPRDFTLEELDFISTLVLKPNKGNKISDDSFVLNNLGLQNLKSFCLQEATSFCREILKLPDKLQPYITQSWVNLSQAGEFHHKHYHNNSYVSGVLYISALGHVDKIHFHREDHNWIDFEPSEFNVFSSPSWFFPVWTGALILFPSDLQHSVFPVEGNHSRISLSFNVFLEGELGSHSERTYLHLPPPVNG